MDMNGKEYLARMAELRNPKDTFQLAVFSRKPVNSSDSGCD